MTLRSLDAAKHWRDRATEMRALAEQMKDPETARMMIKLAADYDEMSDRAAQRASLDETAPSPLPRLKE
jgi:plasmid stability protein